MPPESTFQQREGIKGHKRTYQACSACRTAKLRCDLGDPDAPEDPPCKRCLRTGRSCVFGGVYQRKKAGSIVGAAEHVGEGSAGSTSAASAQERRLPRTSSTSYNRASRSKSPLARDRDDFTPPARTPLAAHSGQADVEFRFVRGENLENPADALRILAAAVEDDRPDRTPLGEPESTMESQQWNRWIPVRDGLLTSEEASTLLSYYAEKINPAHPIVPVQLFQSAYFGYLLKEPILLAAMIVTAARYLDLGVSSDGSKPRRSRVIQGKIVAWLLQRIGFITMGETVSRTIGTIEAFLILSEWPPREQYLLDMALPDSSTKPSNPAKVYDDLSWTLIGLAVRIALELDLQDEKTYMNDDNPDWINHRRHNTWIYCLSADRHASVRLNRASLVQEMSLGWWDVTLAFTKMTGDESYPFARSELRWREAMGVAQLTHTIGLLQEMLYATPDLTAELIRTGRYSSTLHRLKPELDLTWHNQLGDLPPVSVFDSQEESFTEGELTELRWRMEFDYCRLYGNAIAMRAAQDRLLRRHKSAKSRPDRLFDASVIRLAEGSFVIEAVDAAISLVKCGVSMQRKGLLRNSPCRFFLRIVFASVFLMKAVAFGAVGPPEQEVVDLQYEIIEAFRLAAPDDQHVAHHLSQLLSRVLPAIPHHPTAGASKQDRTGDKDPAHTSLPSISDLDASLGNGHTINPFLTAGLGNNWLNRDIGGMDSTLSSGHTGLDFDPLDWDTGIVSGLGYDPSSIVSDIEQILAAGDGQMPNVFQGI